MKKKEILLMNNKRHAVLTCGYTSYPQVNVRIVPNLGC